MNRFLSVLLLLFSCSFASAQPVQQRGSVTPGHPVMWTTNGVVQDAGTAVNGFLTGIGVVAPGKGVCVNSGPITGPYQQLCLSVTTGGPGQIIFQNFGGAAPQNLQAVINGVAFNLPGGGGGGAVNSVSNSDSTLTVSPTTGVVVASLNLANANIWTATQTFPQIIDTGVSGGGTVCLQADNTGKITSFGAGCGGGGGGAVNSVSNSDGTLTVSPTSGAVVASLNTGHANTWSAVQTFNANDLLLAGVTGSIQCLHANSSGVVTGTGSDCGSGGGGGVTSVSNSDGSLTISPITGAVVAGIAPGHANSWTVGQTLGAQTISEWVDDTPPANITRIYDRLFVGGAAVSTGQKPPTVASDWLGAYQNSIGSYLSSGAPGFGVIVAETSVASGNSLMGVVAGARTLNFPNAATGDTALALAGFGLADNSSLGGGSGAWGVYTECHREATGNGSICVAAEFEPRNNATGERQADPFTPGFTVGVGLGCGAGVASTGKPCGEAITILANPETFNTGILFQNNSITNGSGPGGVTVAIALPPGYSLDWFSSASTIVGAIDFDGSGDFQIGLSGTIMVNGTSGVTCTAGTVNITTIAITKGIVTHC